jgi:hypothetical protein
MGVSRRSLMGTVRVVLCSLVWYDGALGDRVATAGTKIAGNMEQFCAGFDLQTLVDATTWKANLQRQERQEVLSQDTARVHKRDLAYGTLHLSGIDQLIQHTHMGHEDVFFDLGSGVGGVVAQVFCSTAVRRAIGVEISEKRAELAPAGLRAEADDGDPRGREMVFVNQNFLDVDLSSATVIYANNLVWSDATVLAMVQKIEKECRPGTTVLSTKMLQRFAGSRPKRLAPSKEVFPGTARTHLDELLQRPGSPGRFWVEASYGNTWMHVFKVVALGGPAAGPQQ